MMSPSLKHGLYAASLLLSTGLGACSTRADDPGVEYAPEMYESIPYEPLRQTSYNKINAFGINERTPANGTVPRGKLNYYDHIPKDSVQMRKGRFSIRAIVSIATVRLAKVMAQ
jgi:hypothetical protein